MNPSSDLGTTPPFTDVVIPSDTTEARRIQDDIEQLIQTRKASEQEVFSVRLALEEALVNAIKHGNEMDKAKKVYVSYRLCGDRLEVRITDEGKGFDPLDVPDPTDPDNLDRPCGRGLMLMRHYMTEVEYNATGNSVSMAKVFRASNNGKK